MDGSRERGLARQDGHEPYVGEVATRKIGRAVRLPEGRLRQVDGDGTSKSAASRRFVALSQERMEAWLLDEILTVNRLRLPPELRRSLACTNAIENMQGTIRRVTRNVKRWRDASMALRWAAAGMIEAKAGFRRLKAHRQLPALRRALNEPLCTPSREDGVACRLAEPTPPVRTSEPQPEAAEGRLPALGPGCVKMCTDYAIPSE